MVDDAELTLIDAVEKAAKALAMDKHHWTLKEQNFIKVGIRNLMNALGEVRSVDCGTVKPADTWKPVNQGGE